MKKADIYNEVAVVVLVGGRSSRMNFYEKYKLEIDGKRMVDYVLGEFYEFPNIYWSVNQNQQMEDIAYPCVVDEYEEIGPMGGIYSAMRNIDSKIYFFTPCDTPFVTEKIINRLLEEFDYEKFDCVVPVLEGKIQPLFGIYTDRTREVFRREIEQEHYKIVRAYEHFRVKEVEFSQEYAQCLANINTVEEFTKLSAIII